MSEAEFIFRSLNTHQVLLIVVNTRILGCVADSLQERRFASISPSDYKDTKAFIFLSKVIVIKVAHGQMVETETTLQLRLQVDVRTLSYVSSAHRDMAKTESDGSWRNEMSY